jgi:hypothetical protein
MTEFRIVEVLNNTVVNDYLFNLENIEQAKGFSIACRKYVLSSVYIYHNDCTYVQHSTMHDWE